MGKAAGICSRVAVIGGGAAGMMAAIAAARNGAAVTIYEGNDRVGKKILATGNGKCNFSNRDFSADAYYGNGLKGVDASRLAAFFQQFSVGDAVEFFEAAGMLIKEKNGYLYPWSEQASTVLDILRLELVRLGVEVKGAAKVTGIKKAENGELVRLSPFEGDGGYRAVVIACGGCAAAKTGSDGSGHQLAAQLGHRIVPTVPALVQLRCSDGYFKMVAGVRCEAGLVLRAGEWTQEERGELLFTDYGISGIPVFQMSRQAAYLLKRKDPVTVSINLVPHMTQEEFREMCVKRLSRLQGESVEEFLLGMANKKINLCMAKQAGLKPGECAGAVGRKKLERLLHSYRDWRVHVAATNPLEQAQVTAGGVDLAEVTDRLKSVLAPGVYFAGEVLDIDGRCGGYNLQWAWTSGYIAGKSAAAGI